MPGVDGAGAGVDGVVVVSLLAGADGAGVDGALFVSFELSLQAASPRNDTAATALTRNFFIMALLP